MRILLLTATFSLLLTVGVLAADCTAPPACCQSELDCCGGCGGKTVCQIVCEMKKVKKTVWTYECEDFCTMLPGCGPLGSLCCNGCQSKCGSECDASCSGAVDGCCGGASCDPCASLCRPLHPPKCGKVRVRKKLVKKEIVCEVPIYKTIVVCADGCGACAAQAASAQAAPVSTERTAIAAPLPPVVRSAVAR